MNQETALNLMKSGKNIFLTGQAGSGKTYVLNAYIQRCRQQQISVAVTASTGIAATHIGGKTIHSWSGIGIKEELSDKEIDDIAGKNWIHKQIRYAKVLIIDEVSLLSAQTLDLVERVIQGVTYDYRPWGGIQIIFCGDFFQLPPITRYGDTPKRFAFAAKSWNGADLHMCYLDTQHRQTDDAFLQILTELRSGEMSEASMQLLQNQTKSISEKEKLVRLYTHNVDVDRVNNEQLVAIPGDIHSFTATTKGNKKLCAGLMKGLLAPEVLQVKIGARVLFVKNNPAAGYRNGTTGEVIGFDDETGYPIVFTHTGDRLCVEPESWSIENEQDILASVTQIPLKLAWAITIHKSQGMTLDAAEIDLSKCFAYGQAYVALSRIRSLEGLRLLGFHKDGLQAHPLVLRGDTYFQEQSKLVDAEYTDLSLGDWEEMHEKFVEHSGGVYRSQDELLDAPVISKQFKKKKRDTVLLTLDLIKEGKHLEEIMELRGLTRGTIISHITKVNNVYPDVDISYLQPDAAGIARVQKVVDTLVHDEKNWTEKGSLRLAAVYHACGEEIEYEDLKLYMAFIEITKVIHG